MKNLKVGKKIFIGFGAVVLMMVLMSASIITTTLMVNSNANNVQISSDLQTAVNNTLVAVGNTQTQANVIYNMTNPTANANFTARDTETKQLADKAIALSQANPETGHYTAEIQAFRTAYDAWSQNVYTIIAVNDHLTDLGNQGVALATQVYQTFLQGLEARIAAGAPPEQSALNLQSLDDMGIIRQGLGHIRDTFDGAEADVLIADIDEVITILEGSIAIADSPSVAENLQTALDACHALKDLIDTFVAENDSAWTLVKTTEAAGEDNLAQISRLAEALDVDMAGGIAATTGLVQTTIWIVIVVAVLSIAVAVIMGLYISRLIKIPTQGLSFSLNYLAETGNLELPPDVQTLAAEIATRKDELGETAVSYGMLMQRLGYISGELDKIANGDLTATIEVASENDAMGLALSRMLEKLNGMFSNINNATVQVSNGSKQIADGAQSLAQGSTEQAASVEELSASIGDVATKTEENANMAHEAARLADTIKAGAEKGSGQMAQMLQAVQEISDASQQIGKVIKAIDDIAFQTNILALNAAVEAARAGEHGKGFAVVADEVRNLAGKSAEAAKDTGTMIASSIEKAELGAAIAQDTAASLAEIVAGINESSRIVDDIAQSSSTQSDAISQINQGIDQVAIVVQQNSATAEESAAASEEMSSQSAMLAQMVAQFKLKDGAGAPAAGLPMPGYGTPAATAQDEPYYF
ncbi:MAG: hypothetical protein GXY32_09030 [Ruminococcaceae bacterium]|nr:hypothetical protein [Oscillospiraceae bacterium]